MRAPAIASALVALACSAALAGCGDEEPPPAFFGIGPQAPPSVEDAAYMSAGGIGSLRWVLPWNGVQPEEDGEYQWAIFDPVVAVAADQGMRVLPVVLGTPEWLGEATELPAQDERQLEAFRAFMRAAVERYGPEGSFWGEREEGSAEPLPIRSWQIWNEANYFHFTDEVSPRRYARLVRAAHRAIDDADPGAELILSGLFADPSQEPPRAMDATAFLDRLYEVPGIAADFDAIALHPYARNTERLEELTGEFRRVAERNGDGEVALHITEMGWGSQPNSDVSFEKGPQGQARELTDAYDYLIGNRDELNLESVYWFTWKDMEGLCSFCDSAGLFHEGEGFRPKPAWDAFVEVTGGRAEP